MGERSRLKQVRRKVADALRGVRSPQERAALVNELLAHDVVSPKKARELLEMRQPRQQRNNLPDP